MSNNIGQLLYRPNLAYRLYFRRMPFRTVRYFSGALLRRSILGLPYPYSTLLGVTHDCQFRCRFCGVSQSKGSERDHLLAEAEIKTLIDELVKAGVLHLAFTGGEPILREDIFGLIKYASGKGMVVSMDSNGLAIDRRNASRLKQAGLTLIKISLHSFDPSDHDAITDFPGAFEKVISAVKNSTAAGLSCIFSTVVTKKLMENDGLYCLIGMAERAGAMAVKISFPALSGGLLQSEYDGFSDEEFNRIKKSCDYRFAYYASFISAFLECSSLSKQNCYISPFGDVKVCMFMPSVFGNIRKENFRSIWQRMIHSPIYNYTARDCYGKDADFRKKYFPNNCLESRSGIFKG